MRKNAVDSTRLYKHVLELTANHLTSEVIGVMTYLRDDIITTWAQWTTLTFFWMGEGQINTLKKKIHASHRNFLTDGHSWLLLLQGWHVSTRQPVKLQRLTFIKTN